MSAEIQLVSCVGDLTLRGQRHANRQPFCCWGCGGVVVLLVSLRMALWCYRLSMVMVVMSCEVWGDEIRGLLFGDTVTASKEFLQLRKIFQ